MRNKAISVIIPTKNRINLLKKCLNALENQSEKGIKIEVIIIDDNSELEVINKYSGLLTIYRKIELQLIKLDKTNRGTVNARNVGIYKAKYEIIGFLDDDSIPDVNWALQVVSIFNLNKEIKAVSGYIDAVDYNHPLSLFRQNFYNQRYYNIQTEEFSKKLEIYFKIKKPKNYYLTNNLSGGNSAIRKTTLYNHNGFDRTFQSMHDKELTYRLLLNKDICVYNPEMKITHHHTKSFIDSCQKSFKSGRMKFQFGKKHKNEFKSENYLSISMPFRIINNSKKCFNKKNFHSLVTYIFILEYLNQLGFIYEYFNQKIKK